MAGVFQNIGQSVGSLVGGTSSGVVSGLPGGIQGGLQGGAAGALGGAAGGAAVGAVGGLGAGDVVTIPGGAAAGAIGGGFYGSAVGAAAGFEPGFAKGYAAGAPEGAAAGSAYGQSLDNTWLGRKVNSMINGDKEAEKKKQQDQTLCANGCSMASKSADTKAADKYKDDPDQLKGRDKGDVEKELDQTLEKDGGWTKDTMKDGNGVRYYDGKGGSVTVNDGYPAGLQGGGGDLIHQGPYVKISNGPRIPLAGNPGL